MSDGLTVAGVLAIEQVSRWRPEVLCGHQRLDRPVRWLHVAEATDVAPLLSGGEMILTTGLLLRGDDAAQRHYVEQLVAADVAALVLDLGRGFEDVPPALLARARELDLPFVVFRRPVPFVQMIETIQHQLTDDRLAAADASESLRDRLTALTIAGAPLQALVDDLAVIADCAVVVESVSGAVLAAGGDGSTDLLRDWERISASLSANGAGQGVRVHPSGWMSAPLSAGGNRWGRLLLSGYRGPASRARMLAGRGAEALVLHRLVRHTSDDWELDRGHALLAGLLAGSLSAEQLRIQARISGLPVAGRVLVPLVLTLPGADPRQLVEAERTRRHLAGLVGRPRGGRIPVLLSFGPDEDAAGAVAGYAATLASRVGPAGLLVAAGPSCRRLDELTAAFADATRVADAFAHDPQGARVVRASDIRLRGLMQLLADNQDVQDFVDRELGPLLPYPELLEILSAYLSTGMNKSATAQRSHLSRPALYRRLEQITATLHVDVDDLEAVSGLYVALLAHRARR